MIFTCLAAIAIDGDTISCHPRRGGHYLVRLAAIDAPEMPGHCRPAIVRDGRLRPARDCAPGDPYAAQLFVQQLLAGRDVRCRLVDADPRRKGFQRRDPYGRRVVRITIDGRDLSDALVAAGLARIWQ